MHVIFATKHKGMLSLATPKHIFEDKIKIDLKKRVLVCGLDLCDTLWYRAVGFCEQGNVHLV
jgi:hypothetical protein